MMKKNAIITNLFNLNMYIFVSFVFLLFLNFNGILLAADPSDSVLNMKILGDKNKVIKNAEIKWLDLRDGAGPDEYFDIEFQNDIFQVRLPGSSTYFFNISADGYKPIVMKKIEVKKTCCA